MATDLRKLAEDIRKLAEAAVDLDWSRAEKTAADSIYCPCCDGEGEVAAKDYTNISGLAVGIQVYGIGENMVLADKYYQAVGPKAILALLDASAAKDAEIARLREALSAACGYMRNAAIDLGTGAPKKTALATVEGGLKLAEAALKEASHG